MGAIFREYTPPNQRSDRSARDRARHKQKIKASIRENIADILSEESIVGVDKDKIVKVPIRAIKEYRFVYGENSPGVAQGNGEQKPGDVVAQGDQQQGQGGQKGGDQAGVDAIETDVTLEELLEIMFDDLELPELERKSLAKIVSEANYRRKGHRRQGIIARLDKKATAKHRLKRMFAAQKNKLNPATNSAAKQSAKTGPEDTQEERFPFHEDDMRFFHIVPTEREASNAVIFCIMDTSGSMGTVKKYLARSFYFLLYQFVRSKYQNVEVVFIAHHTEAKEVNEQEFFHKVESGGTYISSGYRRALDIIADRYHPSLWNIYAFHCSDGDNFYSDNERAVEAAKELCSVCNLFGYGEIKPTGSAYYSGTMLEVFAGITAENFHQCVIERKEDLWPAFKAFLTRDNSVLQPQAVGSEGAGAATP
jgi:sporulation protein YhbH